MYFNVFLMYVQNPWPKTQIVYNWCYFHHINSFAARFLQILTLPDEDLQSRRLERDGLSGAGWNPSLSIWASCILPQVRLRLRSSLHRLFFTKMVDTKHTLKLKHPSPKMAPTSRNNSIWLLETPAVVLQEIFVWRVSRNWMISVHQVFQVHLWCDP